VVGVMPLGLTGAQYTAYVNTLFSNHDFAISVDVLKLDHTPIRSLTGVTLDGQVNIQRDSAVARTATFSFDDPDHSLHLDADSPWEGAVYADRMIQVRHTITVPGVGAVTAVPFVGPIVKVSRDGDTLNVECQDKTCLAITGTAPVTVKKGMNAVAAIRRIMSSAAGENRFRLPSGINRNLQKAYSTGWHEDASPWAVCSRIAKQLHRQLYYSCDGYLSLRTIPKQSLLTATGAVITSNPQVDYDATQVNNMVRVSGTMAPPKSKTKKKSASAGKESPTTKLQAVAVAAPSHPLSPQRLGRNGVPRYMPVVIEGATYKSLAEARQLASDTLDLDLIMTTGVSFDMIPVFHLDVGDVITAQTDMGRVVVRLQEASIPLSVSGDMSVGTQRGVSRGRKTRVTARKVKAKAKRGKRTRHG
jgi:hypothetical protein